MSTRETSMPWCRDHGLHLSVMLDWTPAGEGMLDTHFYIDAELQHHIDEFERTSGSVRVHVDDGRPESIRGVDLRHDFGRAFIAQLGPTQNQRNLRREGWLL